MSCKHSFGQEAAPTPSQAQICSPLPTMDSNSPQPCRDVLMLEGHPLLIPWCRTSPTAKFSNTTKVLTQELRTCDWMTGTATSISSLFREKGGVFPFLTLASSFKLFFFPLKPSINNDGRSYFPWGNANFNAFFLYITIVLLRNK